MGSSQHFQPVYLVAVASDLAVVVAVSSNQVSQDFGVTGIGFGSGDRRPARPPLGSDLMSIVSGLLGIEDRARLNAVAALG